MRLSYSQSILSQFAALAALVVTCLALMSATVEAQDKVVPRGRSEVLYSYAPIVKRVAPTVVNVYVRRKVQTRVSPFMNDPFFRRFFGNGFGIPRERVQRSLGSGVIVSPKGVVVTNYHVIKGGGDAEIVVVLSDNREYSARIVLKDEKTDLAILQIDAPKSKFSHIEIEDSDSLEVGDIVLAIGNPFGVGQTVTSGIVSALARTRVGISDYQFFIQTDAAINPGNSGGALVDMNGRLVGINTSIFSRSGGSLGIGFAIPSNMVRLVVQSALKGGKIARPWFGAKLQTVTRNIAESLGLDRPAGALVNFVYPGGPAEKAGLAQGDVIISVNGRKISDPRAFRYRFATSELDSTARLQVVRDGKTRIANVAVLAAPDNGRGSASVLSGPHPFSGAEVSNLSPALAEELSLDDFSGVVVLDIRRRSSAKNIGLRERDILVRINGERVKTVRQLKRLVSKRRRVWKFSIKRNGRIISTVLGG